MSVEQHKIKTYEELLEEFEDRQEASGELVHFEGAGEKDVYNVSGPFHVGEVEYIAGRVESRGKQDAVTMFFCRGRHDAWSAVPDAPVLDLEDPFQATVGGELIIGGVRITKDEQDVVCNYYTAFYRGETIYDLKEFARGPDGMKDIRLLELPHAGNKILLFTRPQGTVVGGFGRIGVTIINGLSELTEEHILRAEIIEGLFTEKEWGGVNDLYLLPDGSVGALYHIARFDEHNRRHYCAAAFVYDVAGNSIRKQRIVAVRGDYPESPVKMLPHCADPDDLKNVLFPTRLILEETHATLYGGLSDTRTGKLVCPNPFAML